MTRRTRTALALSAVAVVLAVAVTVLVVGRGDGRPETLPVRVGGGGDDAATSEAMVGGADQTSAPAMVGGGITWEVVDGLPALDGEAPAYRLGRVDDGDVADLAAALGLDGEVTTSEGMFEVTDGDRGLQVLDQPGASWSFYREIEVVEGGGTSGSSGAEPGTTVTGPPTTLAPVPEADAEAVARAVAEAAGIDMGQAAVAVDDGGSERIVRIDPVVGDLPTWGLTTYIAVGPDGAVSWANGMIVRPERGDTYPLVGTAAAADRLGLGLPGQPIAFDAATGDAPVSSGGTETAPAPDAGGGDGGDGVAGVDGCDPELGPDGDAATRDACPPGATVTTVPEPCDDTVEGTEGMCAAPVDPEPVPCDPATGPDGDAATEDACPDGSIVTGVPPCDPATGVDGDAATDDGCPPAGCVTHHTEDGEAEIVCPTEPVPLPEPEPVVAKVTGVRLGLAAVPTADGTTTLLVPAYLWEAHFPGESEPTTEVTLAVDEEFLLPAEAPAGTDGSGPDATTGTSTD